MKGQIARTANTGGNATPRIDVYERVAGRIVAELEQGTRPWLKPWTATDDRLPLLPLRANGTPYRGINILLLWGAAFDGGYRCNIWMTYRQAAERGAQVRKGEHGALVVYADQFTKTETDDKGEDTEREIPFLKAYTVFNVEQIDGLPAQFYEAPAPVDEGRRIELIEEAEDFIRADRCHHRPRRQPGVLRRAGRPHPDAAAAGIPGRAELHRHQGARTGALERPPCPPGAGIRQKVRRLGRKLR